ncbi:MAG: RDD family protein [Gaiellales bacterium]
MNGAPNNRRRGMVGVVVTVGRFPVRVILAPARGLVRSQRADAAMRSGVDRVTGAVGDRLENEAGRAVDAALTSPVPEAIAQSLVEHRIVQRMAREVLAKVDVDEMVASVSEDERTERIVRQLLASPALEQFLAEALESKLTSDLADKLLQNPELQRVIDDAVRSAMARQATSLADQMAGSARRADDAIESPPRRWFGRAPRPAPPAAGRPAVPYAGLGSRGAGFLVDFAAVHILFLIGCGLALLAVALIGRNPSQGLADVLAVIGWVLVVMTYTVGFWSGAGQTPGMRMMRLRVAGADGRPPGVWRSLIRLAGLIVAILFVFIGILPMLVDERRRALQDFLAGTVVLYEGIPSAEQPPQEVATP